MFKIITNGVEPTLTDISDNVKGVMSLFHEDLFLDTEVIFVGSNKDRIVEISKFTDVEGKTVSVTYTSAKCLAENILVNEWYANGDHLYRATITNNPSWVILTERIYEGNDIKRRLKVYIEPKSFDLVEFVTYFFNIMCEVKEIEE